MSQESVCNKSPFHLSSPAATVEAVERKPSGTSCACVTFYFALVPRRNKVGTEVLTGTVRSLAVKAVSLWKRYWREIKG